MVLSQIDCFIQCKAVGSQISLDDVQPRDKERKGKERKSIYVAPFCTKVHTKRSGMDHTVLPANNTMPDFPSSTFTRCHHHSNCGSRHPIAAHYSFIDPERMKG